MVRSADNVRTSAGKIVGPELGPEQKYVGPENGQVPKMWVPRTDRFRFRGLRLFYHDQDDHNNRKP